MCFVVVHFLISKTPDSTVQYNNITRVYLEKFQEGRFSHAGFLNQCHGVSEVVDIVAVDI